MLEDYRLSILNGGSAGASSFGSGSFGSFNPYEDYDTYSSAYADGWDLFGDVQREANAVNADRQRKEDMAIKAAEYKAAIDKRDYENWYNSPAEQVKRMRAAGLNPDLLGLEGSSPSAGVDSPGYSSPGALIQAASTGPQLMDIISFVGEAASIASTLESAGLTRVQKDIASTTLDQGRAEVAEKIATAARIAAMSDIPDSADIDFNDWLNKQNEDLSTILSSVDLSSVPGSAAALAATAPHNYTPEMKKEYFRAYKQYLSNPGYQAAWYKAQNDVIKERKEYVTNRKSKFYSSSDSAMGDLLKFYIDFQDLNYKRQIDAIDSGHRRLMSENKYYADYTDSLDPMAKAESENETYRETAADRKFVRQASAQYRKMVDSLYNRWQAGDDQALSLLMTALNRRSELDPSYLNNWQRYLGFNQGYHSFDSLPSVWHPRIFDPTVPRGFSEFGY